MSQDQRDQEYRLKAAEHAFGPKEPEIQGPPKPTADQKKSEKGEPGRASKMASAAGSTAKGAALDNPLVSSVKATAEGLVSGGKRVADAIYPPALNAETPGVAGRVAEGGLGLLDQIMSAAGVSGGSAFFQDLVARGAGANKDEKVPLPAVVRDGLRTAEALFSSPQGLRDIAKAKSPEEAQAVIAAQRGQQNKDWTYHELAGFLGGLSPAALHAPGAKGAEKPAAAPGAAPAAGTAAGARAATAAQAAGNIKGKTGTAAEMAAANKRGVPPAGAIPGAGVAAEAAAANQRGRVPAAAPAEAPVTVPEPRAVHEGTTPPAEALGVEPIPEAANPDTAELQASLAQDHAIISAERPNFTPEENAARTESLKNDIVAAGSNPTPAKGVYGGVPENSFFAQGMPLETAQELGKKYEQESVIHNRDLHYVTGENAGKVRPNLGTSFDVPEGQDGTQIGNARFSNSYDWEGEPVDRAAGVVTEPAAPVEEAPAQAAPYQEPVAPAEYPADAPAAAPGAVEAAAPEAAPEGAASAEPEAGGETAAQGVPQVQTVNDLHEAVAPAAATYGPPDAATVKAAKERGIAIAQDMRAQGAGREAVREALRANLNESGLFSENQLKAMAAEASKVEAPPVPSAEDLKPEHIDEPNLRAELVRLKNAYWDLHDKVNAVLGINENTVGGGVPLRGDISQLGEAGKAAQTLVNQMAHVGGAIIIQGAKSFKAWAERMRQEFGDLSDELLKKLYPKAQASLASLQDAYPEMLTPKGAQAAFTRGQKGALWYDKAPEALAAQYGPENVHMAADVYAATSINTNAATTNITLADKAIRMLLSGERDGFDKPFTKDDGVTAGIAANVQLKKLNEIAQGKELEGVKIGPYSNTLKGLPKGVDAAGNMVFEPVLDSWMGRGFGFAAGDEQWSPTEQQRAYVNKVISDIAAKEGVQPQEVQAAMWVDFKTASDLQKLKDKPKWKTMTAEQRQEAVDKVNKSNGTPFDQLLQNRLGPSIRAAVLSGDTGPTAAADYLGRKVVGGLIEDQVSDPTTTATLALQEAGLDQQTATPLAARILQSLKDRMNSTDPEGARFNQTNMGFNPLDLFNIFKKNHDLAQKPFDMEGAREALTAKADELKINDALHLDLGEAVGPTEAKAAADAHLAAKAHLADVLDRVINGAGIEEGELHHAAALTGAAAEKTRVADIREGSAFGRRTGGPAVKPITEAVLGKATERLAGAMSEPELAGWLKGLGEDYKQSQWLANNFRAAAMDTHGTMSPQGLWHLMMANMVGAQIAGPSTLIKSLVSHGLALPYAVAVERGAEAFGKYWPDQKGKGRVVPGSAEQLKAGIMGTILDTWKLYAEGDQKALTAQAEQVGELHLPVPNAATPFDNIINSTLGLPGSVLSRVRAPARVGLTRGFLNVEALAQATREAELDPSLKGDKFDARITELQANPSVEMLHKANEGSDKWSFTTPLKGLVGAVVQNDAARIVLTAFARIDMSLMKHAVESNPLTGLYSLGEAMREGGPAWDRARAKYALGASAYLAALTLASQGLVTGPGPVDPRANEQWVKDRHQPDSIWNPITETWQSHRYIPILSGILSTAGQSMAIFNDENDPDRFSKVIRIAWAQGNMLTHSSLANAFADLAKAISSGFDGKEWWNLARHKFEAMGGFLTEGPVKQATDYFLGGKPVVMPGRTTPGANVAQTELEKQWAMIQQETTLGQWASWDEGQPLKRDHISGEKIQRPGMFGFSAVNNDPVAHVFSVLGSDQRGLKYALPYPKQTIGGAAAMNGQSEFKGVELSNWEYDRKVQFQTETKIQGKTLHEALADLIDTKKFKDAMDEADTPQRRMEGLPAIMLRQVYSQYETTAENMLLAEDKHLQWLVNVNKTQQQALAVPHARQPQLPPEPDEQKYPRPGQLRD